MLINRKSIHLPLHFMIQCECRYIGVHIRVRPAKVQEITCVRLIPSPPPRLPSFPSLFPSLPFLFPPFPSFPFVFLPVPSLPLPFFGFPLLLLLLLLFNYRTRSTVHILSQYNIRTDSNICNNFANIVTRKEGGMWNKNRCAVT
jgi:hypothetical protein